MPIQQKHKADPLFSYLFLLTSFFLLLEIGFFIQCNRGYLSDYTFVSNSLHIPLSILPGVLSYAAVQLGTHLFFCLFAWAVARSSISILRIPPKYQLNYAMMIWFIFLALLLAANQFYFPNSKFSRLTSLLMLSEEVEKLLFTISVLIAATTLLPVIFALLIWMMGHKKWGLIFCLMALLIAIPWRHDDHRGFVNSAATTQRPNVILIGVDSLRPDFTQFFGGDYPTPFMDAFFNEAVVFSDALTPLARTFPSWMSILNGRYPKEIGIRTNLTNLKGMQFPNSLPSILQNHGYETIYATDEARFSNIDKLIGFNQIYSPPMGLNDFLLGTFNDFPLTNLLVNTQVGRWLLPYGYANRAVYFTYHPDTFIRYLKEQISRTPQKPLFLAVHFCLPHYPYLYSRLNGEGTSPQERYVASIKRVDQQLKQFYAVLNTSGLLKHSLIVLLSDHGEALEFAGDRITEPELYVPAHKKAPVFYPASLDGEGLNQSAGHGTDVLGLPQYHSVLAFQGNGLTQVLKPRVVTGVVSLLDIQPTILDLLNISTKQQTSGVSLAKVVTQPGYQLPARHLFLESDFSSEAIRTVYPEIRKVLLQGIDLFEIDQQSTRLTVKPEMVNKIINSKQYADIYGEWMLAIYPQEDHKRIAILINLNSGRWTDDLNSVFAQSSPVTSMLAELKSFYGIEIGL